MSNAAMTPQVISFFILLGSANCKKYNKLLLICTALLSVQCVKIKWHAIRSRTSSHLDLTSMSRCQGLALFPSRWQRLSTRRIDNKLYLQCCAMIWDSRTRFATWMEEKTWKQKRRSGRRSQHNFSILTISLSQFMMLIKRKALRKKHTRRPPDRGLHCVFRFCLIFPRRFSNCLLTYHIIAEVCEEFIVMILVSVVAAAAAATRIRLNIYDLWDEED